MNTATETARPLDKRPFFWMLGILSVMVAVVLAFQFAGNQKLHNTALWQRFHPVTLVSPPQVATPVEVIDTRRIAQAVVQTEKGLYFLTGAQFVPEAGSKVVVQSNERWDLFLCAEDGSRCMSIHSFCADAVWPNIKRDEQGRIEWCNQTAAAQFGIDALQPAKGALRQGVIFDLDDRIEATRDHRQPDPRDTSVRELQRRFQVDTAQATRVRQRALSLWQGLAEPQASADGEHTRELGWAAALHEIGMMVSHHDHHRHSAYLLGHVDASGYSQSQLRRLATLALGQRGELIKLAEHKHDAVLMSQVMCLRLAIILHHARMELPPKVALLQRGRTGKARLVLSRKWAQMHPRTLHLLDEEVRRWAGNGDRQLEITLA